MKPDTCHCCKPPAGGTPVVIDNRPGLSAVAYRVGTFANFRQAMFQAISRSAELHELSTRQSDDYAITILELWAAVADILTFYQERIANEAFLRTARWRESVLRMARMIGYELSPGSAATAYLSFTAEKDKQVAVPVGLRVQSVPEQDEKPQKYETLESLTVYDWLNEQSVFPAPLGVNPLAKGSTSAYLAPGDRGLAIAESLVEDDRVLLFDPDDPEPVEELIVKKLEVEHEHMKAHWATPVQGANWNMTTQGAKLVRSFRLFGYNVPPSYPKAIIRSGVVQTWKVQNLHTGLLGYQSSNLAGFTGVTNDPARINITIGSEGPHEVSIAGSPRVLNTVRQKLEEGIQAAHTSTSFTEARVERENDYLIVYPGVPGDTMVFETHAADTTTLNELGFSTPAPVLGPDSFAIAAGNYLYLDSIYDDLKVGTRLLLADGTNQQKTLTVMAVDQDDQALGSVTNTVTRVTVTPAVSLIDDRRQVIIYELSDPKLSFWGFRYPSNIDSAFVYVPGQRIDAETIEIARPIEKNAYQDGYTVKLTDIESGRQVLLKDESGEPIAAKINRVQITGNEIVFGATTEDAETVVLLALDQDTAKTVTALSSAALVPFPALASPTPSLEVTIGSIGPRTIALGGTLETLIDAAASLQSVLRATDTDPVFAEAFVRAIDNRLVVLPGDFEASVKFSKTMNDETTVVELGLEADLAQALTGIMTGALDPDLAYTTMLPQLSVGIGPIASRRINLDHTVATLDAIASDLESKLNTADIAPFFKYACVRKIDNRLLVFPGMIGLAHQDYLKIELRVKDTMSLDRTSAVLMGNVAQTSHGETVTGEVLGDADPTVPFQEFALKKSPVTFVPSAGEDGADNTLQLFVNDVLWKEVDSLFGQGATEPVYTSRINDDAEMSVRFGDGVTGARPPKGRANVVASYRQGIGLEGRVKAGQLRTLLDKPKGLKAAINPAGADGGADPETLDDARQNAPATVRTFDRAVSLLDLEDLARSRSEVAKAKVTWVWSGDTRAAHLTIAGQNGSTFSSLALKRIHASLTANRDPNRRLMLANYITIPILITATLKVADTYVSSKVAQAARAALLDALSFESLAFAQSIHLSDVYAILQNVSGVVAVDIDGFMYKQNADVTDSQFAQFLNNRGIIRVADGTPKPIQNHLWILGAQPNRASNDPAVLPAEQAHVDSPSQDVIIFTRGGLPD